jgi:hypothetical protein
MADFRKLFYAPAMVALVVGLSIPVGVQGGAVTCNAVISPPLVRAKGYGRLVGYDTLQYAWAKVSVIGCRSSLLADRTRSADLLAEARPRAATVPQNRVD